MYCTRRIVSFLLLTLIISAGVMLADDYLEDVYFWSAIPVSAEDGKIVPNFSSKAREIIFIEDTTSLQHPDTVRAIIREAR